MALGDPMQQQSSGPALPPGAVMVDDGSGASGGMKLPPGATLVDSSVSRTPKAPSKAASQKTIVPPLPRAAGLPAGIAMPPQFPQTDTSAIQRVPDTAGEYVFGMGKAPQSKRAAAALNETAAPGNGTVGVDQKIIRNMPQNAKQFGAAAANSAGAAAGAAGQGISNFYHAPFDQKVGEVVMSPLTIPMSILSNLGQSGSDVTDGRPVDGVSRLMGGNPEAAQQSLDSGDVGGYAWNMFGQPAALGAATEGAAKGLGTLADVTRGERFANNNFSKLIAPGFKGDVLPYEASVTLRPLYQQEAAAMGLKDESLLQHTFTGDTPTRSNPLGKSPIPETVTGMKKAVELSDRVVARTHAPIDAVMQTAGADPVPPKVRADITSALQQEQAKASRLGAKHAGAYQALIDRVQEAQNLGELNQIKKDANNMIEGVLNGGPSENAALSVEPIMAWKKAGEIIRSEMYPELQRYVAPPGSPGYFDIAEAGKREALAMDARDGIYANYKASGVANLPDITKKYLESVGEGSMYKTHVVRRALKVIPTPAGEFNQTFRRGLGKIGEGAKPETVAVKKQQLKLPPPAPAPTPAPVFPGKFDVPTALPQETVAGAPQSTPQQQYLGTRQVPNPGYTPIPTTSAMQQVRELGSTAHTIPDRTRGITDTYTPTQAGPDGKVAARLRADQVGVGHMPHPASGAQPKTFGPLDPPVRTLTGEPTVTASNWQYLTGAKEPPQEIMRNGAAVMRVTDPKIAQTALEDGLKFAKSDEFKTLPKEQQLYHRDTITKLQAQMKEYNAWRARNPEPQPAHALGKEPEFEVWLNPGVAGKIAKDRKLIWQRTLTHGTRLATQAGINHKQPDGDDLQRATEEEERLMRQPQ